MMMMMMMMMMMNPYLALSPRRYAGHMQDPTFAISTYIYVQREGRLDAMPVQLSILLNTFRYPQESYETR